MAEQATVLVVDDEPAVVDLIENFLDGDYRTVTAGSGGEALDVIDDAIDIVLLDRLMPDLHGDDVLEEIRTTGYNCGVIMVSAVEPDVDVATLQYNEYLVKPISQEDLHAAIERTLTLSDRDIQVQEYFALADKIHALKERRSDDQGDTSAVIEELENRMETMKGRIDPPLTPLEKRIADRLAQKWPERRPAVPTED